MHSPGHKFVSVLVTELDVFQIIFHHLGVALRLSDYTFRFWLDPISGIGRLLVVILVMLLVVVVVAMMIVRMIYVRCTVRYSGGIFIPCRLATSRIVSVLLAPSVICGWIVIYTVLPKVCEC